jgi:hypothetical protein
MLNSLPDSLFKQTQNLALQIAFVEKELDYYDSCLQYINELTSTETDVNKLSYLSVIADSVQKTVLIKEKDLETIKGELQELRIDIATVESIKNKIEIVLQH